MSVKHGLGKMSCVKLLLSAGLVSVLMLSGCGGKEDRQAEFIQQAQQFMEAGDYESARIDVKNALQINSNNAEALYLMALLEERDQNWRAMYGALTAAVQLDPAHLDATIKYGQLNLLVNNLDEAKSLAQTALHVKPE